MDIPTIDQCMSDHWLRLSPSHLEAYREVPEKVERERTKGLFVGVISRSALRKKILNSTHTQNHTHENKRIKWRRKERPKNISNRSPEYHTCQIYWYMLLWEWGNDTWVPICDHALAVSVQVVYIVVSPPALIGVHTDGLVVQAAVILLSLQYCFNPQSKQTY